MKKLIALLLCLMMVVSVFVGCQDTTPDNTGDSNGTTSPSEPGLVSPYPKELADAEEIPYTPLYKLTFDDETNLSALIQERHPDEDGDGVCDYGDNCSEVAGTRPDGATYAMAPYNGEILFTNGPVGQCVYLDGTYGLKLDNLVAPTDDSYTISFWVNADRFSDFQPTLQIGRNIGDAGDDKTVTWINVTQCPFPSVATFPTIWNRNSSLGPDISDGNGGAADGKPDGVWPWINRMDEDATVGKRSWAMITIVATGETYEHIDATTGVVEPRVGCYMYINGVEVMNGTKDGISTLAMESTYHGLSPEIFMGDGLEGYLGINYWDYTMKGYMDELYIYDEALTAGQVATLWAEGDASVKSVEPEGSAQDPTAPVDPNAIDKVGTPDMLTGWWSDWSKSYELAEGASVTVKLNNYSLGGSNWNNWNAVFANVATPGHSAPAGVEGYVEYAVVRSDLYGWGPEGATYELVATNDWLTGDATTADAEWAAWRASMTDAEVTMTISRTNGIITLDAVAVCADGKTFNTHYEITSTLTAEAPCHFFFVCDTSYLEILEVK